MGPAAEFWFPNRGTGGFGGGDINSASLFSFDRRDDIRRGFESQSEFTYSRI